MKMILILIVMMSVSCGKIRDLAEDNKIIPKSSPHKYSMKDHNPIVEDYLVGFPNRSHSVPVVLVSDMGKAGLCYKWSDGHHEIEISQEVWNAASNRSRQWLMWHEMHHCENDANHSNDHNNYNTGGICNDDAMDYRCNRYTPLSLMRWYLPYNLQISRVCDTDNIDDITRTFCDNLMENDNVKDD